MLDIIFNHTYTVTLFQKLFGEDVINRFSYVVTDAPQDELQGSTFLDNWWDEIEPALAPIQNDEVSYVKAQVFHLGGTEGTFEKGLTGTGDVLTASFPATPSWLCMSFRQFTTEGISRSGWKRIAGLVEGNVVDNALDFSANPNLSAAIATFQTVLEASFDGGLGIMFAPAVTRLIEGSSPPAFAGFRILDVVAPFLGSQVSRKPGHGD